MIDFQWAAICPPSENQPLEKYIKVNSPNNYGLNLAQLGFLAMTNLGDA